MISKLAIARRAEIFAREGSDCTNCGSSKKTFIAHTKGIKAQNICDSGDRFLKEKKYLTVMCKSCLMLTYNRLNERKISVHGEFSYYTNKGCRCALCTQANKIQSRATLRARMINKDLVSLFKEAGENHHKECFCGNDQICEEWLKNSPSVKRLKGIYRLIS